MTAKRKAWGGKRKGAGRPRSKNTPAALAREMGLDRQFVHQIISGTRLLPETYKKWAKAIARFSA